MFERTVLSPPTIVRWCGFEAHAGRLQACGWEFAAERHAYNYDSVVLMRHRTLHVTGRGVVDRSLSLRASRLYGDDIVLDITQMTHDDRWLMSEPIDFSRIDMLPSVVYDIKEARAAIAGVFRPWAPEAKEIIVEPATVASLLEQIQGMQSKELAEVRARNRQREARERYQQESVVAQVIAIAA